MFFFLFFDRHNIISSLTNNECFIMTTPDHCGEHAKLDESWLASFDAPSFTIWLPVASVFVKLSPIEERLQDMHISKLLADKPQKFYSDYEA